MMANIFQKLFFSDKEIAEIQQRCEIKSFISNNSEIHKKTYQYMIMYSIETDSYQLDADRMLTPHCVETPPYRAKYFLMYIQKKSGHNKNTVTIQDEKFARRMYNKMQRKWNRKNEHVR